MIISLEIKDFKSYKGVHSIGPFKTFTSIIGPNGSGKSNLMDAIIFVLGNKANQMRGASLKELIYFGADSESPDTYVRLNFLHQESNRVYQLMRKIVVHEGGKYTGTYYVDGKDMRAKEFQGQLQALGINVAAKNYYIFQGDIESYANQPPKKITETIESVCGSEALRVLYTEKKREVQQAEEDLKSANAKRKSILHERDLYKEQHEEAKVYSGMQDRIDGYRAQMQLAKLHSTKRLVDKESEKLDRETREIERIRREMAPDEKAQSERSLQQAALHKETMALEDSIEALSKKKKRSTEGVKNAEEIRFISEKIKKTQSALERVERAQEKRVREVEQLRLELVESTASLEHLVKEAEGQVEGVKMDHSQIEEYNRLKLESGRETSQMKMHLDALVRAQKLASDTQRGLDTTAQDLERMREQFSDNATRYQAQKESTEELLTEVDTYLKEAEADLKSVSQRLHESESRQKTLNNELEKVQYQLSELKSVRSETQREKKFNQIVTTLQNVFPGVYGKLIDHCEPVQKKYSTAIYLVIGKLADAIVVDTESTLSSCLLYLKEQMLGVATFIALDNLSSVKQPNEKYRQLGGTCKLVFDCIKLKKPELKDALLYAVGNTIVCEHAAEAKIQAFDPKDRKKVVTTGGVKITKSGLISGGGLANLKAKASAETDGKKVDDLKKQRDDIMAELSGFTNLTELFNRKQTVTNEVAQFKSNQSLLKSKLKILTERHGASVKELEKTEKEVSEIRPRSEKLRLEIEKRAAEIEDIESKIRTIEDRYFGDFSKKFNVDNIREFEDKRLSKVQENIQKRLQLTENISKIQSKLDYEDNKKIGNEIKSLQEEIETNNKLLQDEIQAKKANDEKDEKLQTEFNQLTESYQEKKTQMEQLNSELKKIKQSILNSNNRIQEIKKNCSISEFKLNKFKAQYHDLLVETRNENIILPFRDLSKMQVDEEDEEEEEKKKDEEEEEEDSKRKKTKSGKPVAPKKQKQQVSKRKRGEESGDEGATSADEKKKKKAKDDESSGDEKKKKKGVDDEDLFDDEDYLKDTDLEAKEKEENLLHTQVRDIRSSMSEDEVTEIYDEDLKLQIDFTQIKKLKIDNQVAFDEFISKCQKDIDTVTKTMETVMPNNLAFQHLKQVLAELKVAVQELDQARQRARQASDEFRDVESKRDHLFNRAYKKIKKSLTKIYGELTRELEPPYHRGSAHLELEDISHPYNGGIKYTVIPPNKRFQDMDQLSGGEKSVAALALLFSLQGFRASPFLILDEIDAAFDTVNVLKLVRYVKHKASRDLQFIVISLKDLFYVHSDGLVGVCREIDSSSKSLTLALDQIPESEEAEKILFRLGDDEEEEHTSTSSATTSGGSSSSSSDSSSDDNK